MLMRGGFSEPDYLIMNQGFCLRITMLTRRLWAIFRKILCFVFLQPVIVDEEVGFEEAGGGGDEALETGVEGENQEG
ncbi:hypothetical protein EV2_028255 [Malus domestica]